MNEERIREIASQCSAIAVEIPFFRGIENGLTWEATIQKARDLKFAELIVRQMLAITDAHTEVFQTDRDRALIEHIKQSVKQHFGVEQ